MNKDVDEPLVITHKERAGKPLTTKAQGFGSGPSTVTTYSRLAIRLQNDLRQEGRGSSVLVMPADFDRVAVEASTELAWHLAEDLGRRVLLVDGSFNHLGLTKALGGEEQPGLMELLASDSLCEAEILGSMRRTGHAGIAFIPVGQIDKVRLAPARSDIMRHFLALANGLVDFVVIQGPPVEQASRTLAFGSLVDAVLLVTLEGQLPIEDLVSAQQVLRECGVERVGLVIGTPRNREE